MCNNTFTRNDGNQRETAQIKIDYVFIYVHNNLKQFFPYYKIKQVTVIIQNPTGKAVIERANHNLKVKKVGE